MTTIRIFTASLALGAALASPGFAHGPGGGTTGGLGMMGTMGPGMGAMNGMGPGMMGGAPGMGPGMMGGAPGMGRMGPHGGGAAGMGGLPGRAGMGGMHVMAGMMQMMMQMHGGGGMSGMGMMGPTGALAKLLDEDGDGTVTPEEAHDGMQALLTDYDADGDEVLSLDEYAALHAAVTWEAMVDGFQALDADGDGKVTASEMTEPADRMARMRPFAMPGAPGGGAEMPDTGMMGSDDDGMMDGQ